MDANFIEKERSAYPQQRLIIVIDCGAWANKFQQERRWHIIDAGQP